MTKPHVAVEQIPPVLKSIPHWVCWKYIERAGKRTKCPVNAVHGWNASSTDPNSWCTFEAALTAFQKSDTLAGVGFVFSADDPFCGIALDDCITGQRLAGTPAEVNDREKQPDAPG